MLYRMETGPHAGLDDTQGRKTAQQLRRALGLSVAEVRQIKVFTVDGLDETQARRLTTEGVWHDPILQQASLEPLPASGEGPVRTGSWKWASGPASRTTRRARPAILRPWC